MPATMTRSAAVASRRQSTVRVSQRATVARSTRSTSKPKLAPAPAPVRRSRPHFAVFVMLVAVGLLSIVGSYAYMAQQQFQVSRLQKARATEQKRYEQLRLEVAQLTAPERIVSSAQKLGMVTPDHVTYIQVTSSLPAASDPTAEILSDGWRNVKADLAKPR